MLEISWFPAMYFAPNQHDNQTIKRLIEEGACKAKVGVGEKKKSHFDTESDSLR